MIALVTLAVILASSSASAVSDSDTLPVYSDMTSNEMTTNQTQASNSSASATITITMYAVDEE